MVAIINWLIHISVYLNFPGLVAEIRPLRPFSLVKQKNRNSVIQHSVEMFSDSRSSIQVKLYSTTGVALDTGNAYTFKAHDHSYVL